MRTTNNKGTDQPAHPRSLISAFVVRCLDSVMSLVSVIKISSLMLASVDEQASVSMTWSETPEDTFSRDEAQIYSCLTIFIPANFVCVSQGILYLLLHCIIFKVISEMCYPFDCNYCYLDIVAV